MPQDAVGGNEAPQCNADSTCPAKGYQPRSSGQDTATNPSSSVGDQSKSGSDQQPRQLPGDTDRERNSDVPPPMIDTVGASILDEVRKDSLESTVGDGGPSPQQEILTQNLDEGITIPFSRCEIGSVDVCRLRTLTTSGPTTLTFSPPVYEPPPAPLPLPGLSSTALDLNMPEEKTPTMNYDTEPIYVLQLVDYTGEVIRRQESAIPVNRTSEIAKTKTVLELVTSISSTGIRSYSSEDEKDEAFRTGTCTGPVLKILSPLLINALNAVISYYPEQSLDGAVNMVPPYKMLVHYRKELEDYKMQQPSSHPEEEVVERNKHIDCALKFLRTKAGTMIDAEEARWAQSTPTCTFENYWMLLRPGERVYSVASGIISSYIVKQVTGGIISDRPTRYTITLWNLDYNGRSFGRCLDYAAIQPFEGERAIASLPVYPTRFHVDAPGETPMWDRLIKRGRRFVQLTKQTYCDYKGYTITHPRRYYHERIMVDTAMLPWEDKDGRFTEPAMESAAPPGIEENQTTNGKGCNCPHCLAEPPTGPRRRVLGDYDNIDTEIAEMADDIYFLCAPHVLAYVFKARAWELLDVECIQDLQDNRDLIDKLVISEENKYMIRAICRTYARGVGAESKNPSAEFWSADFVQGKGEGRIFLLHGKPGVGKTLTAECVAEYTQRPLLALTPGDIGTEPTVVETTLQKYFKLGEMWGAILLLDEADVYLEARNLKDLVRNSLVSVFLRAMEYYQGILFLTTNRVGSFDEAFASRIHVHLHYGNLQSDGRSKIWDNLFEMLENDRGEIRVEYQAIQYVKENEALLKLDWNGRQIRNAFQTAVSLAEYDAQDVKDVPCKWCKKTNHLSDNCWTKYKEKKDKSVFLKQKHFEMVTNMSRRFQDYLESATDTDPSKMAKSYGLRDDDYEEGVTRQRKEKKGQKG